VQIPFTPSEISLGFGLPPKGKEPIPEPIPELPEFPPPMPPAPPGGQLLPLPPPPKPPVQKFYENGQKCYYAITYTREVYDFRYYNKNDKTPHVGRFCTLEKPNGDVSVIKTNGKDTVVGSATHTERNEWSNYPIGPHVKPYEEYLTSPLVLFKTVTEINNYLQEAQYYHTNYWQGTDENPGYQWFVTTYHVITITASQIYCPNLIITPPPPPPPPFPNPPPRKRNMDECCRESTKFLRAIYKGLGIAKFPGKLPSTIIQEVPKEGEQPAEPPQEPVVDFVDLLMWQFRRDDERWGQWEIEINIKDADLTKEGNQGKSVKFPNLAESVAEIEGQMLSIQANVEALVALSIRNLSESGMARQEAIKGYLASMAIVKYMAFPFKEYDVEIPSTYTPGATSIDKLIVESIIHTKGIDYENKETQRDLILDLLQAAAIIRAVHWRQVDPKKDVKNQILSQLKGSADLSERITNVKAVAADSDTTQKSKDSWEDKLDQYENGFGFATGIEDANTPYGRDREQRPRIRQIGDNIAQAGKKE
jgi:hypothetical protein